MQKMLNIQLNNLNLNTLVQGGWPGVPTGKFIIAQVLRQGGGTTEGTVPSTGAAYNMTQIRLLVVLVKFLLMVLLLVVVT